MFLTATTRLAETVLRGRLLLGGSDRLRARMMMDALPGPAEVWVHAASVGEVNSASVLIRALAERHSLLVTTNSETGLARARSQGWPAMLAPLDLPGCTTRFLNALRPRLAITVEAELWPTRARLLASRGIPHVIVGARMSERSARRWSRLPGVIGPVLRQVGALSAQDADSEARLLALGLPRAALLPRLDLKLLAPAKIAPPPPSAARDRVLLAASTHPGEDEPILDAYLAARTAHPDLQLILAPRHPERADQMATLIAARGLDFARRTDGAEDAPLLLADTLGEMPLWYARAGICLTGGSLMDHGGHTPWEPAAFGCAILHGPNVSNFTESYAALDRAGAARQVAAADLAPALSGLLADPTQLRRMGQSARGLLDARAGDPVALLTRIGDLVQSAPNSDMMSE
ncbi:3-deoxy-D-manno-octulosonic acid transferase [Paracoccus sp. M683]|uniref:3-deoxy-D-manno-octulosonic acid transferase n=1 Tax=Paracoccus sp. M683 TaxID=2594268 RepID=UPI001180D147|nr:glycosyltransferase N-terminal domain-containing protein [Paracoccus sp. M683]TRW97451.1 3-deoxy-D-manno-octulosonic acid transferase [Paracoccus sp. M683]